MDEPEGSEMSAECEANVMGPIAKTGLVSECEGY